MGDVTPSLATSPLAVLVSQIRETYRVRCDYHSAEKRLTLQVKALGRRAGLTKGCSEEEVCALPLVSMQALALLQCRDDLRGRRQGVELALKKMARKLPAWKSWAEGIKGAGDLGLAQIVGEAGDLSHYSNPAKLWRRMGLAVFGGVRDQKGTVLTTGERGYSPRRRSVVWNVGDCFIRAGGPYRAVYDERKDYEAARPACGKVIKPQDSEEGDEQDGKPKKVKTCRNEETGGCRPGHVHNRAKRYMEKRYLRDLWRAWGTLLKAERSDA